MEFLRRSFLVGTSLASVSLKRTFLAGFLQVEFPRWNSQGGVSWLEFPGLLFSHGIVLENLTDLGGILYRWNSLGGTQFLAGTSLLFLFFAVKLSRWNLYALLRWNFLSPDGIIYLGGMS